MEELRVCRICLITDVRMYDLRSYPLSIYYEPIPGANPLSEINLPTYACYECAILIKKFYFFREKCLRGQATLYALMQFNDKLTTDDIKNIDRQSFLLSTNFVIHKVTEESIHCYTHEDFDIKAEPHEKGDKIGISSNIILDSIFEKTGNIDSCDQDLDNIKQEDDGDDFGGLSSDNEDAPLSIHKSNKDKKETYNKVHKIEKLDDSSRDTKTKTSSIASQKKSSSGSLASKPEKSKRGRPRKAAAPREPRSRRTQNTGGVVDEDVDLSQFVTVITLSIEEQKEEILKRQLSSNYRNAPFKCNLCYKGFIDTDAWNHHVGKHDVKAGEMECPICKFRFKSKRSLQKHSSNHGKKYACKSCSYVSTTTTQAKQHQRWHEGVTYKCQYCDEISTKWTSYLSHVRIKHPSEFICGVCGYSFVSKLGLTMHKTMMHKDVVEKTEEGQDTGPYCEQCDVKFISEEAWKRHMVTSVKHTKGKNMNGCRVCGESFTSAEALRVHHRTAHARKRPKNYGKTPSNTTWPAPCEHCSEVIANAREYWTHFRRVHPDKHYPIEKNYVCDICGKSFRGNAFLVYHRRTHSEQKEYACGTCGKAFHNRTNLHVHRRTHSDERPHACSVCCKAFKGKGALDRHFRSHTGVKPYECEVCGKAFAQSNSRKLHVRTVHLKQPSPYISRSRLEKRNKALAQKEPTADFLY
ncbi:uncharacterized protein [Epargyreus clarus]|uniref:uncharacterized protein n=1 Tax=Epargyreus clarus TaxID=520877 RepID=UPI003C2E6108